MEKLQISLAAARVNAKMTQEEAAKKLSITQQTLVSWEKGKTEPTISQFRAMSDLYKMPLEFIFIPEKSN